MMLAKNAREMTKKAVEMEIATRRNRAESFCNELTEGITEACKERKDEFAVPNIPYELYNIVIAICKENGYRVTQLDNKTVVLHW